MELEDFCEKMKTEFQSDLVLDIMGIKLDGKDGLKKSLKLENLKSTDYVKYIDSDWIAIEFSDILRQVDNLENKLDMNLFNVVNEIVKSLLKDRNISENPKSVTKLCLQVIRDEFVTKYKDTFLILKFTGIAFDTLNYYIVIDDQNTNVDEIILLDTLKNDIVSSLPKAICPKIALLNCSNFQRICERS